MSGDKRPASDCSFPENETTKRLTVSVSRKWSGAPIVSDLTNVDELSEYFGSLVLEEGEYCNFGSGMKELAPLSNFAKCETPFSWKGSEWLTSEHAYQAYVKLARREQWARFAKGGDLSSLEVGVPCIFPEKDVAKKLSHYAATRTGRPEMLGIVAKMAVKPDVAKRLGLELKPFDEQQQAISELKAIFSSILVAKYDANPRFRSLLLGTRGKVLVEFNRGAEREAKAGRSPLWSGLVSKRDGRLYGRNLQGIIQMCIRDQILADEVAR